jgi:hypothetical protein
MCLKFIRTLRRFSEKREEEGIKILVDRIDYLV